jgi:hypothetical protein
MFSRALLTYCQSSRRHGAGGPGQLLIGIRDLGSN